MAKHSRSQENNMKCSCHMGSQTADASISHPSVYSGCKPHNDHVTESWMRTPETILSSFTVHFSSFEMRRKSAPAKADGRLRHEERLRLNCVVIAAFTLWLFVLKRS
ncbi:uncharacterized protein LOC142567274 isoform X2 [Dermacentor variabilis]